MNDYKELIAHVQGDAAFRHIISECGADGRVWFDKRFICDYVSHLKYAIEQLVRERDAYAKAFRITSSDEPLINHAVVKIDYADIIAHSTDELVRAIAYRLSRVIEDARSKGGRA